MKMNNDQMIEPYFFSASDLSPSADAPFSAGCKLGNTA
jgi:hypothetical protein